MDTQPPQQPHPALRAFYSHIVETMVAALPPPIGGMPEDPPGEALARRDRIAIAVLASLAPADAAEAALATQCIVAGAHATYYLSQVAQHSAASALAMKLRSQFASFEREARRSRSLLLTMQEKRYKREAANRIARPAPPRQGEGPGAGGDLATQGGGAVAPPTQPPAPPEATEAAPPRRSRPVLRIIQGGLGS